MNSSVEEIIKKFGLNKGANRPNPGGFSAARFERPTRQKSVMVAAPDVSAEESEARYNKSLEDGMADYRKSVTNMFKTIGTSNLKASKNRFRKGDAVTLTFIQEEPEPPKIVCDPKNINLSASLVEMRKINEERKRIDEVANYTINRVECQNLQYATSYKDRATNKVVKQRKDALDSNFNTKKELGNTRKETKIASINENEFILKRMKERNRNFSRLVLGTGIVERGDESVEQASLSNSNIKFVNHQTEEDLIAGETKEAEKVETEEMIDGQMKEKY